MFIQVRAVRMQRMIEVEGRLGSRTGWERLVRVALAINLVPALLVVLLVGGIGMLILAAARAIVWIVRGPVAGPRNPVDPGSSSS